MITKDWIMAVEARRQSLKAQHNTEDIWDFEQSLIVKLIEAENALEHQQAETEKYKQFARDIAELAPNTHAALFTERERIEYTELFYLQGRSAKQLLPDEYKPIESFYAERGEK